MNGHILRMRLAFIFHVVVLRFGFESIVSIRSKSIQFSLIGRSADCQIDREF